MSGEVGGRSPAAVGGESRRSLLCSGGAGAGCARYPRPAGRGEEDAKEKAPFPNESRGEGQGVLFVQLEDGHEGFLGDFHAAQLTHAFFALLLLFEQLLLAGDVAAVAFGKNILAHGLYRFARDDLAADSRLNGDLEKLSRDVILELFRQTAGTGVGIIGKDDEAEGMA